ncbi:MAG: PLD nuclease N-terminal domain-containing protein [Elusimicrobiota bacterium]|nr:PLD nuclease N-terminal domain-containing protein [Elusimicrobiota bacterium]
MFGDHLILFIVMGLLGLLMQISWLWMLIDCIRNEVNENNERVIWVLIMLFFNVLGAVAYFIFRYSKRKIIGSKT